MNDVLSTIPNMLPEELTQIIDSALPLDLAQFAKWGIVFLAAAVLVSFVGSLLFGKRSSLSAAISSAIAILFIYVATVVCQTLGAGLERFLAPLPFVWLHSDTLILFNFYSAQFPDICTQLVSMILLAFLVNIADKLLPQGEGIVSWLFFRVLSIVLAMAAHLAADYLLRAFLPEGIITYAPTVLLVVLVTMLLTGGLKLLVGLAIATVNPLIAALYTFFFATVVGKQISKAVLTASILAALVAAAGYFGVHAISITPDALLGYCPFLAALAGAWYVVRRHL